MAVDAVTGRRVVGWSFNQDIALRIRVQRIVRVGAERDHHARRRPSVADGVRHPRRDGETPDFAGGHFMVLQLARDPQPHQRRSDNGEDLRRDAVKMIAPHLARSCEHHVYVLLRR